MSDEPQKDTIEKVLRIGAYAVLVGMFGVLPLIFLPQAIAPFEYTKALVAIASILVSLILFSLSTLRTGTFRLGLSYPLLMLWVVVGIMFISALLSGDFRDALVGDYFSIHSVAFVMLIALTALIWVVVRPTRIAIIRLFLLLAISTIVLTIYHFARILMGADFLSFRVFSDPTSSPVGSWNDLGLFLGMTVILSLIALEQLALSRLGKVFFAVVCATSTILLAVVNFFAIWIVLGLTSLVIVVYTLGKDRFVGTQLSLIHPKRANTTSLFTSLGVLVVSVLFIIGGSALGGWIATYTNVSYIEVRPTLETTSNIARQVYEQKAFLGIGPNKFVDAWRLYKDISINTTPFWNTDFNAGSGYIPTFFVTTGVLGGVAWMLFILTYVFVGIQKILRARENDKVWYFIAVASFVGSVYIWGMSLIYVPGMVILLLAAVLTGVSLHAFSELSPQKGIYLSVGNNRGIGFLLTMGVVVVIIGSVATLYMAGRQYASLYAFNKSVESMQAGKPIGELEQQVLNAYSLSTNDIFARRIAEYQFSRLNTLVNVQNPSEAQKQEFNNAMVNGIRFGREATRIDPLEPANWAVLAGMYSVLASQNVEGAQDLAREAFTTYQELNPKNPLPYLELAVVEMRAGDYEKARSYITEAIALKSDFTEAYYLLTQLEIAKGDVTKAIESAQATIALDPENAVRYYQLGVLESAHDDVDATITAFEKAVSLDPQYANARYLLALAYDLKGRSADARTQLAEVYKLNPENTEVRDLIGIIDSDGSLARLRTQPKQIVQEQSPTTGQMGEVKTQTPPESTLVAPVNTPPQPKQNDTPTTE